MALPADPAKLTLGAYHSTHYDISGNRTNPEQNVPWQLRDDPVDLSPDFTFEF